MFIKYGDLRKQRTTSYVFIYYSGFGCWNEWNQLNLNGPGPGLGLDLNPSLTIYLIGNIFTVANWIILRHLV